MYAPFDRPVGSEGEWVRIIGALLAYTYVYTHHTCPEGSPEGSPMFCSALNLPGWMKITVTFPTGYFARDGRSMSPRRPASTRSRRSLHQRALSLSMLSSCPAGVLHGVLCTTVTGPLTFVMQGMRRGRWCRRGFTAGIGQARERAHLSTGQLFGPSRVGPKQGSPGLRRTPPGGFPQLSSWPRPASFEFFWRLPISSNFFFTLQP